MPTYEYKCPQCDQLYEAFRPIEKRHDPFSCQTDGCDSITELIISTFSTKKSRTSYTNREFKDIANKVYSNP